MMGQTQSIMSDAEKLSDKVSGEDKIVHIEKWACVDYVCMCVCVCVQCIGAFQKFLDTTDLVLYKAEHWRQGRTGS